MGDDGDPSALLAAAYDQDLSAVSVLAGSVEVMADENGWTVLDTDWEMYSQSRTGAVIVLALGPRLSADTVVAGLRQVGYAEPAAGTSNSGVWTTSGATATTVQGVSPRLANVAVLAEEGLVVASDSTDFAEGTIRVAQGEAESLGDVPAGADVAAPLVGSAVAVVHSAANGCATGSYVDADTGDANQAELAANAAGGLTPPPGPGARAAGEVRRAAPVGHDALLIGADRSDPGRRTHPSHRR
ncbi:MAG: hypothetical protein H0V59_08015 [Nocardioidaceae bacterium]|nr:hypothetical protein [Nocardioidaceae bacterium]